MPPMHSLMSSSPGNSPTTADFQGLHHHHPHSHVVNGTNRSSLSRQQSYQHISQITAAGAAASPVSASPSGDQIRMDYLSSSQSSSTTTSIDDGDDNPLGSGRKRQRMSLSQDDLHHQQPPRMSSQTPSTATSVSGGASPISASGASPLLSPPRKPTRARSDSAPMGMGYASHSLSHHHPAVANHFSPSPSSGGLTPSEWASPVAASGGGILGRPRSGSGMVFHHQHPPPHHPHQHSHPQLNHHAPHHSLTHPLLSHQQQQQGRSNGNPIGTPLPGTPMPVLTISTVVPSNG